ncbi:hypothetical protein E2C01_094140 [Portunus trituberculatus]|uniref:Uncharacterized protein n=1 Tax=Portunus trituberculatus TaxID=210409 RepID=A0A5B7JVD6_PORTR|nr:hypothetical protein [Portunus trituberculatus]
MERKDCEKKVRVYDRTVNGTEGKFCLTHCNTPWFTLIGGAASLGKERQRMMIMIHYLDNAQVTAQFNRQEFLNH